MIWFETVMWMAFLACLHMKKDKMLYKNKNIGYI